MQKLSPWRQNRYRGIGRIWPELKVSACPIGACPLGSTFFAELCLLMNSYSVLWFRIWWGKGQGIEKSRIQETEYRREQGKRRGAAGFSFVRWAKAHTALLRSFGRQRSAGIKYGVPNGVPRFIPIYQRNSLSSSRS